MLLPISGCCIDSLPVADSLLVVGRSVRLNPAIPTPAKNSEQLQRSVYNSAHASDSPNVPIPLNKQPESAGKTKISTAGVNPGKRAPWLVPPVKRALTRRPLARCGRLVVITGMWTLGDSACVGEVEIRMVFSI